MSSITGPPEHTSPEPPVLRMGHDLVRNFSYLPGDVASEEIATHIKKFWERRMRWELVEMAFAADRRIDPLLLAAVRDLVRNHIFEDEIAEPSGG